MSSYKIGYLVGSLSSTSINRTLSKALIRLAPDAEHSAQALLGDGGADLADW